MTKPKRRSEFDYLRVFVILVVLWHHAMLSYTTWVELVPYFWRNPIPVVDSLGVPIFDALATINDAFMMPLLFLVSGLFVWEGLTRKGAGEYLSGRIKRLGIPFVAALLVIMPLAYIPAHLQVTQVFGEGMNWFDY
jgi:fucose 4-O-acetylase-like acetyltransferase